MGFEKVFESSKKYYIVTTTETAERQHLVIAKNKTDMLASLPAIQPVSNKDLSRMASGYGHRIHPIYKSLSENCILFNRHQVKYI